jgi:sugar/nucleoside kinase (ribokinase family)
MPKRFDVLTFGDNCVDLIITGADVTPQFGQVEKLVEDYTLEMGGSCNIFACQAAKLGLRAAVLGRVGADSFGELILHRLGGCGVDTGFVQVDPTRKTGLGIALCPPGDRAILTYMGTINAVYPSDVTDEILAAARHVHHGSHYLHTNLQPAVADIFRRAHRLEATTSLDTNWDPQERWDGGLAEILLHTDLFLPNEQEAQRISRRPDLDSAARHFLDQGVRVVAIKRGAQGSAVYTPQENLGLGVTPVSGGDSIGAGDSYDAGFLAGWLRGLPLQRCLEIATACGSAVAAQVGGLAGQPRWDEL